MQDDPTGLLSFKENIGGRQSVDVQYSCLHIDSLRVLKLEMPHPAHRATPTTLQMTTVTSPSSQTQTHLQQSNRDSTITVWGSDSRGGDERKASTGTGYNGIYATYSTFVAIKENGALFTWGMGNSGVIGAPTDSSYAMSPCTPRPMRLLQ